MAKSNLLMIISLSFLSFFIHLFLFPLLNKEKGKLPSSTNGSFRDKLQKGLGPTENLHNIEIAF